MHCTFKHAWYISACVLHNTKHFVLMPRNDHDTTEIAGCAQWNWHLQSTEAPLTCSRRISPYRPTPLWRRLCTPTLDYTQWWPAQPMTHISHNGKPGCPRKSKLTQPEQEYASPHPQQHFLNHTKKFAPGTLYHSTV